MRRAPPLLLLLAAAACAGGAPAPTPHVGGSPTVAAAPPDAATAVVGLPVPDAAPPDAAPPPDPRAPHIELTFAGDVAFGGRFRTGGFAPVDVPAHDPLADVAPLFAGDLALVNLETTVMDEIPPLEGPLRFVATPDQVAVLPRNGVRAVTLANNHIGDVDADGIDATLRHLAALGLQVVGAPRRDEPRFVADTLDVAGWKVAVVAGTARLNRRQRRGGPQPPFAFDEAIRDALVPVITAARADHDLVIVVVHWGKEYADAPHRWQVETARAFVDAGADAVIGHHPHVLQGIERYRGRVIAYSLGNFVFQNATEPERYTGVLRLGFARDVRCPDVVAFHPAEMKRRPIHHPEPATGVGLRKTVERLVSLSAAPPLQTRWEQVGDRVVSPPADDAACP